MSARLGRTRRRPWSSCCGCASSSSSPGSATSRPASGRPRQAEPRPVQRHRPRASSLGVGARAMCSAASSGAARSHRRTAHRGGACATPSAEHDRGRALVGTVIGVVVARRHRLAGPAARPADSHHPGLRLRRASPGPARLPGRRGQARLDARACSAPGPAWPRAPTPPSALPRIVDTSVAIDGRILDVVRAGFLHGTHAGARARARRAAGPGRRR